MDRFFFDVYNAEGHTLDEEGLLLHSRDRAKDEALRILHDIARDELKGEDLVKITVKVRNQAGGQIFEASLILTSGWSVAPKVG
jgi:hypothetical protein